MRLMSLWVPCHFLDKIVINNKETGEFKGEIGIISITD